MKMLTRREVAARLGISERTLDRMAERHDGPPMTRVGRQIRFEESSLKKWIRERAVTPAGADKP